MVAVRRGSFAAVVRRGSFAAVVRRGSFAVVVRSGSFAVGVSRGSFTLLVESVAFAEVTALPETAVSVGELITGEPGTVALAAGFGTEPVTAELGAVSVPRGALPVATV